MTPLIPVLLSLSLSFFAIAKAPFSTPMPAHLDLAQVLLQGSNIVYTAYPTGYPLFLALTMKCAGLRGVFLGQAALYLGIILVSYRALRLLGVNRRVSSFISSLLSFHPYLLLNIKRIVDTNLAIFLTLGLVYLLIWFKKNGIHPFRATLGGILLGCLLLDRQNAFSLLPLLALVISHGRTHRMKSWLLLGWLIAIATATLAVGTFVSQGKLSMAKTYYSAYNFYAGANPYTFDYLIRNLDAEYSIESGLAAQGAHLPFMPFETPYPDPALETAFWRYGMQYVREHPFVYAGLALLKIFTLFRPDYRRVETSGLAPPGAIFLAQTLLALPFWIWLATRWRCRHIVGFTEGLMAVPLFLLWVVPFALSNVDPRFRLHIEIILILDSFYCWYTLRSTCGRALSPAR